MINSNILNYFVGKLSIFSQILKIQRKIIFSKFRIFLQIISSLHTKKYHKTIEILSLSLFNITLKKIANSFFKMTYPLSEVALQYIQDDSPNMDESSIQAAHSVIDRMILKQISYEDAFKEVEELIGTSAPAEKIRAILEMSDKPDKVMFNRRLGPYRQKSAPRNWSTYENQRLLAAVFRFGENDWDKISEFVGNDRSKWQCSQRWFRGLDPKINKGPWTQSEDDKLFKLIQEYGNKSWKKIANYFDNRSDVQCRYRYKTVLKKKIDSINKSSMDLNGSQIENKVTLSDNAIMPQENTVDMKIEQNFEDDLFGSTKQLYDIFNQNESNMSSNSNENNKSLHSNNNLAKPSNDVVQTKAMKHQMFDILDKPFQDLFDENEDEWYSIKYTSPMWSSLF